MSKLSSPLLFIRIYPTWKQREEAWQQAATQPAEDWMMREINKDQIL